MFTPISSSLARWAAAALLAGAALAGAASGGPTSTQTRSMAHDPSLNHLIHPAGYEPAAPDTLGRVDRLGNGPRSMVLVAGLGFGGEIFRAFMEDLTDDYTMFAVTLPGFSGSAAPPNPPAGTSFGEQAWTRAATRAVAHLMRSEALERPVLVGHWLVGTQVALRLALEQPEEVSAVVLIGGAAKFVMTEGAARPEPASLEERVAGIDRFMAPRWFKSVTRETWDDNNFLPGDYARHPLRALQLWRQAAAPPLHVWVPWLCEFFAQDVSLELGGLRVPTLVLRPGFDADHFVTPGQDYMRAYTHASWEGADVNPYVRLRTIAESRLSIMDDRPRALHEAVTSYLAEHR